MNTNNPIRFGAIYFHTVSNRPCRADSSRAGQARPGEVPVKFHQASPDMVLTNIVNFGKKRSWRDARTGRFVKNTSVYESEHGIFRDSETGRVVVNPNAPTILSFVPAQELRKATNFEVAAYLGR